MTDLLPGQAAPPDGPADLRKMCVLRHGFRRDLACFRAAVRFTPASAPATGRALLRRRDLFAAVLCDHHRTEDEVLWPHLRDRAAQASDLAALKLLEDMESEHAIIDRLMNEARRALERQVSRPADRERERDRPVATFEQLAIEIEIEDHLAHEERDAIAILQRYVGDEAWADLGRRRLRGGLAPGVRLHLVRWGAVGPARRLASPLLDESEGAMRVVRRLGSPRFGRLPRAAFAPVATGVGA